MFKTIEVAADCEIRSVIRFLNARSVLPSEIHHQTCQVYCDNAMIDGMEWVRIFNAGQENVNDEVRIGRLSLVNDDLVRKVNERVRDDRRFTISDLSLIITSSYIKKFLGCKRFDDDDDLKDAVQKWLTSQAAAFYEEGIQKLVPRYDKCLNNGSKYVEK